MTRPIRIGVGDTALWKGTGVQTLQMSGRQRRATCEVWRRAVVARLRVHSDPAPGGDHGACSGAGRRQQPQRRIPHRRRIPRYAVARQRFVTCETQVAPRMSGVAIATLVSKVSACAACMCSRALTHYGVERQGIALGPVGGVAPGNSSHCLLCSPDSDADQSWPPTLSAVTVPSLPRCSGPYI